MVLNLSGPQLMYLVLFAIFINLAPSIFKLLIIGFKLFQRDKNPLPFENEANEQALSSLKIKREWLKETALPAWDSNRETVQSSVPPRTTDSHNLLQSFNSSRSELTSQPSKTTGRATKSSLSAFVFKNTTHGAEPPPTPHASVVFATISTFRMTDTKAYHDAIISPSIELESVGLVTSTPSASGINSQEASTELEVVPSQVEHAFQDSGIQGMELGSTAIRTLLTNQLVLTPSASFTKTQLATFSDMPIPSFGILVLSSTPSPNPIVGHIAKEAMDSTREVKSAPSTSGPIPTYGGNVIPLPPQNSDNPVITPAPSQTNSNSLGNSQTHNPTTLLTIPTSVTGVPLATQLPALAGSSNSRPISNGAIAGIVIGGVAIFSAIVFLIIRFCIAPRYAAATRDANNSINPTVETNNSKPVLVNSSGARNHSLKQQILSKIEKKAPPKFGMCTCSRCWKEKESVEDLLHPGQLSSSEEEKGPPKFGMCTCSSCWKAKENVEETPYLGHIRRQPYPASSPSSPVIDDETSSDDIQQQALPHPLHPTANIYRLPPRSSSAPSTILGLAAIPPHTPNVEGVWAGGVGIASAKTMDQQSIYANSEHSVKMLPGYERFVSRRLPFLPVVGGKVRVRDLEGAGFDTEELVGDGNGDRHRLAKATLERIIENRRRSSMGDLDSIWKGKGKEVI